MSHQWIRPTLRALLISGDIPEWVRKHPRAPYVIRAVLATPPWVDRKAMKALADKRDELTRRTGIPHTLDHIVPLNHPRVCGLNVPWNLRVIPRGPNALKSNAWCEWHGDLFSEPEQFRLFK
jgi:hypothetical protein